MTPPLELWPATAGPSVVEGGFAVGAPDADGRHLLELRGRYYEKLAGSKKIRRQFLCATRYALRRGIQSRCTWLPKSVRMCGSRRPGKDVSVNRSSSGHPVWMGVNRCGDPRACPVCSASTTAQRRDELLGAFDRARELGWGALAVALTVRHGIGHQAVHLTQLISTAYRLTFERAAMRKLLKRLGHEGAIRIVEVNHSWENGYHPHLHLVLMFNRTVTDAEARELKGVLFDQWVRAVNDARIRVGVDIGLPDLEHGVHVDRLDLAKGPEYFVKVGLVAELLGQFTKRGRRGSRTMWEVARDMVVNDRVGLTDRANEDESLWLGYVVAMRHFKSFFVATRLRRKLMAPFQLALELNDQPELEHVHTFTDVELATLKRAGPMAMAAIDEMVEDGAGSPEISAYLARLLEYFEDLDDRLRGDQPVPFSVTDPLPGSLERTLGDRQSMYGAANPSSLDRTVRMLEKSAPADAVFDRLLGEL